MANKYTDRELLDFNYVQSDKVNSAEQQKTAAEQALSNLGAYNFTYGKQADYDKAMDAILNRKKFSYDLNGDALYQQYKDNYINQGKMAMMDTMGQAAAMTGGYGNSYAATVGNQAYQASLQNLNNVIPQLYQLALESYKTEGDRLNNNLNVLGTDRQVEETSYNNKYNADLTRLTSDRDYFNTLYNNERTFDYGNQRDTVDLNNQSYWNEYNAGYKEEQDRIANERAATQLRLQQEAQKIAELQAGVVRDDKGNIVGVSNTGKYSNNEIPQYILDKVASFDNDFDLNDYLYSLESSGTLTNPQARELYNTYAPNNTISYEGETYLMTDNGGANGFLGMGKWFNNIDDNARVKVKGQDGTYAEKSMRQLYNEKIAEGMSDKEAKKWVQNLQSKLGV